MVRKLSVSFVAQLAGWVFISTYLVILLTVWAPHWNHVSLANEDRRHGWLAWSQISPGYYPWDDPVLSDPVNSIPRLAMLVPNSFLFIVRHWLGPQLTWIFAIAFGWIIFFVIIRKLFILDRLSAPLATILTILYISALPILADLPPLSLNQFTYLIKLAALRFGYGESWPLFYDSFFSYFSVPYFFGLVALTVHILTHVKEATSQAKFLKATWILLCVLMPIVYFFHFVQFVALLPVLLAGLLMTKRVPADHAKVFLIGLFPWACLGWMAYYLWQTSLTSSSTGYEYMLSVGLQEHRSPLYSVGGLFRTGLFLLLALTVFRPIFKKFLVPWISLGIYLEAPLLQNIQVVLGKTIQPSHFGFLNPYAVALLWMGIGIFLWKEYLPNVIAINSRDRLFVGTVLLIVAVSYHSLWNLTAWKSVVSKSELSPDTLALFDFLKSSHTLQVFLTNDVELESQILFLDSKNSFLPWGALSIVNPLERMQRAAYAWEVLQPSIPFGQWLRVHSWQLFHMKYGADSMYSSTLWYDPQTHSQILAFNENFVLPEQENKLYLQVQDDSALPFRLDAIIYKEGETLPPCVKDQKVLFMNSSFVIYEPPVYCSHP